MPIYAKSTLIGKQESTHKCTYYKEFETAQERDAWIKAGKAKGLSRIVVSRQQIIADPEIRPIETLSQGLCFTHPEKWQDPDYLEAIETSESANQTQSLYASP